MKLLDTGVRFLPRREWVEHERLVWRLYGASPDSIRSDDDGTLVMPCLAGETLAALLEDPDQKIAEPARKWMIEWAAVALADFHRLGLTHGDAMAENVMIDVDAGVARWFDFETTHESSRARSISVSWQRADDVRALLATCLVRTAPGMRAETLRLALDAYADEDVTRLLIGSFGAVVQRPLMFHLGQAPLSYQSYREIACLLNARLGDNVGARLVSAERS
jgi:hypothetical protein